MPQQIDITAHTRLLGVMGWPVDHSLSPPMQNAALQAAGLDYVYVALPVPLDRIHDAVRGLRGLGFRGANVTIPHKHTVLEALDELDESVAEIDAVNTIVVEEDGRLIGHNTDAEGFVRSVREQGGVDPAGKAYFQVGGGGAGRAMAVGMARAGASPIFIANRTVARAERIVEHLKKLGVKQADAMPLDDAAFRLAREADIVANATSLGLRPGDPSPLPPSAFHRGQLAYDSVYVRRHPPFLEAALQSGARAINGMGMLVHQGALSFRLWTGKTPDVKLMLSVLERELGRAE